MTTATAPRGYLVVFLALLAMTAVTILVASVDLGPFSTPVALLIAALKALLVILFFMHLRDAPALVWMAAIGGFFWLGILVVLTLSDVLTRGVLPIPGR
jgi:cytochrome c oxidase subunit 4